MSADGDVALVLDGGKLSFVGGGVGDEHVLLDVFEVVAAAVVDGAIWAVTREGNLHTLHRLDTRGTTLAPPVELGALGDEVVMRTTRSGARIALVEGTRSLELRETEDGEIVVTTLGKRVERIVLAGRGVLERFGANLVAAGSTRKLPTLALPVDATRMKVRSGHTVLDGAAAAIELEGKDGAHVLLYDLRQGALRSRVRLGEARILAVAEHASLLLIGRGANVATLDLRQGRCTHERVLPVAPLAIASNGDATCFVVCDEHGCTIVGADLAVAPPPVIEEVEDPPSAPVEVPVAPVEQPEEVIETEELVIPRAPTLPEEEIAKYLEDLFQLVSALCLVRATVLEDDRLPPTARVANALSAVPAAADARTRDALAKIATWDRPGVPHVEIAAELGLSKKATAMMLVIAAPQLWSEVARAYGALVTADRPLVDEMLLGDLLGIDRADREQLACELDAEAPLIKTGAIARGEGPRMFASLVVDDGVIARLRGNHEAPIGTVAAIAKIADRIPTVANWNTLVLPVDIDASLRELVARIRMRDTVLGTWGMSEVMRARGVTALFRGLPGTGKSLAASAIAGALGLPLYRVDVSRVFSKWVGETERNLAALLDAAEDGKFVLLFDEADSLFGKRKQDGAGSNDRYANVAVNYLLQRLDRFDGIAILTTNFGTAIDQAFLRRVALDLQIPAPDEPARLALWRGHIPATVPTQGDVDLELAKLAAEFPLTGGYIRNICVRACYLAAAGSARLAASHLRRAVELEYADRGKLHAGGSLV